MPLILFLVLEMSDLILILTAPTLTVGFSLEVSLGLSLTAPTLTMQTQESSKAVPAVPLYVHSMKSLYDEL